VPQNIIAIKLVIILIIEGILSLKIHADNIPAKKRIIIRYCNFSSIDSLNKDKPSKSPETAIKKTGSSLIITIIKPYFFLLILQPLSKKEW
tara:strand:- start:153 stop:425 length:273 start_codon:yes stop_codon:yes gene_type:complete